MKSDSKWHRDICELSARICGYDVDLQRAFDADEETLAHIRAELERMGLINKRGE